MDYVTIEDMDVAGKKVLLRADLNVPLDKDGKIANDRRIHASLPTIQYLLDKGAEKIMLITHLGKPKGQVVENLRLDAVAERLSELLGVDVRKLDDCVNIPLPEQKVVLFENLRFHPGEEANDMEFANALANYADVFVNDAFGTCHRKHASIVGIPQFIPACAGLLVKKEIDTLEWILESPEHPFVGILGCAKISDKISVMQNLLRKVDKLLLGGAIVFTFYRAMGYGVGQSMVEEDHIGTAKGILEEYREKLVFPEDIVTSSSKDEAMDVTTVSAQDIPDDKVGLDVGPATVKRFSEVLAESKTVFWNGPLGRFEIEPFGSATKELGSFIAEKGITSVIGGGDTASAMESCGLADSFTHVSTGGGATLNFIEGRPLPGIEALRR